MQVYLFGTLLSCFLAFFIKKIFTFKSKKTLKMFISILPLTIISVFRYDVGWDYIKIYTPGFLWVGKYGSNWFSEPMFNLLVRFLYNVFGDPLSLFVVMGVLSAYFFSKCYSEFSDDVNPIIYIILYLLSRYYFCSLNIMRQALSIMIIIFSTKYITEKKFLKYSFYVVLASLFHQLSLVFLPLYFILDKKLNKKNNVFLLLFIVPFFIILGSLILLKTKYIGYFDSMFGNDGGILFGEMIICLSIFIISLNIRKKIIDNSQINIFFNMQMIGFIFVLFSWKIPTADRLYWYFGMQNIFLIPKIVLLYEKRQNRIFFSTILIVSLIITFISQTYYNDSFSIIPYKDIFSERH